MRRLAVVLAVVVASGGLTALVAGSAGATGTPAFSIGSASVTEGSGETRSLKLDITLSEPATTTVKITYVVNPLYLFPPGDFATAGSDYVAKSGTLTFTPNAGTGLTPVEKTLAVVINGDTTVEPDESFVVLIGSPTGGAVVDNAIGYGTIIDDDAGATPSVGIGDVNVFDGDSGPNRAAQVVVALSEPAAVAQSVHYAVTPGTAVKNVDFTAAVSGNLSFPVGVDEKTITINAIPDGVVENGECLTITLSAPTGGLTLGRSVGTVTIRDSSYRGCAGPRVTVAGDSITNMSNPLTSAALGNDYHHRIEGLPGFTIAQVTPTVAAQAATAPDISVINLGTNDMGLNNANWQTDLDAVIGLIASVPCAEYVTIYDGYHSPANNNIGTAINTYLASVVAGNASRHLIDWNGAVDANPALLGTDHVHPTTAGRQWIADHIKAAIDADC
jgi:lysophospholipase L1-like esterase